MGLFQLKAVFLQQHINKVYSLLCCAIMLTACRTKKEVLPFYNTADFTAEWIEPGDYKYNNIHKVDTFTMQSQLGHLITKDSLDGYIYIANFFFTTCQSICPRMTNNLQAIHLKTILIF